MPRYPSNAFEGIALRAGITDGMLDSFSRCRRSLSQPATITGIYQLCDAITAWLEVLEPEGTCLLVASATTRRSLLAVFQELCSEFDAVVSLGDSADGPRQTAATPPGRGSDESNLNEVLEVVDYLAEYVVGTANVAGFPGLEANEHNGPVDFEWSPAEPRVDALVRGTIPGIGSLKNTRAFGDAELLRRLANLGQQASRELLDHLSRDGRGGVSMGTVGEAAAAKGGEVWAAHQTFEACIRRLAETMASDDTVVQTQSWPWLGDQLLAAHEEWNSVCIGILPIKRHTRQSKRNNLRRHVGLVSKYAHLVRGAEHRHLVRYALHCIRKTVERIRICTQKMLPPGAVVPQMPARDQHKLGERLTCLLADPEVWTQWRRYLGPGAERCGKLVRAILGIKGQPSPWLVGEKVVPLARQKVLVAPTLAGRKKELIELLNQMQVLGLAAQLPWGFIEGATGKPPTIAGARLDAKGTRWLVNPLGLALLPCGRRLHLPR